MGTIMRVDWDTSDDDHDTPPTPAKCGLPETIEIPDEVIEEEKEEPGAIADWLSDQYGYCVFGVYSKPKEDKDERLR